MLDMFNFLASKHRQPPEYNPQEEDEEEMQLKYVRCVFVLTLPRLSTFSLASGSAILLQSFLNRRTTSMDLPLATRLKNLRKSSRESVGVYRYEILFCFLVLEVFLCTSSRFIIVSRSAIHGRGLFCKRNIDAGEMVIEYSGNVIRSVLTDKREKYYDGKVKTLLLSDPLQYFLR